LTAAVAPAAVKLGTTRSRQHHGDACGAGASAAPQRPRRHLPATAASSGRHSGSACFKLRNARAGVGLQKEMVMKTDALFRVAVTGGAVLALGLGASGCASHKFVRDQVAVVEAHTTKVEGAAGEALARANAAHKLAEGKFLFEVVLSDDSVKFPVDKHALSPEAEQRLSELVTRLKTENRNVYLEIQGYTDSTGTPEHNDRLGAARAEAVRRYLSQQGVALNRMSTISYGQDMPAAPNDTAEGRSQNRRVAIIVLS
jgi:outer membrane protein OmpA-like peptidoglycan-associated protein